VLISIILFTMIYAMLFLVWITVLNRKIQTGPEDELSEVDAGRRKWSWIDSATALASHGGDTMTGAKGTAADSEAGE
jgi:hypothetical protein